MDYTTSMLPTALEGGGGQLYLAFDNEILYW